MVIERNKKIGRLKFVKNFNEMVQNSEVIFVAVGNPSTETGAADLKYVEQAVRNIAKLL
jgi:UDPglucose 6-dehydrogenase